MCAVFLRGVTVPDGARKLEPKVLGTYRRWVEEMLDFERAFGEHVFDAHTFDAWSS
jgi:hypothetical protein